VIANNKLKDNLRMSELTQPLLPAHNYCIDKVRDSGENSNSSSNQEEEKQTKEPNRQLNLQIAQENPEEGIQAPDIEDNRSHSHEEAEREEEEEKKGCNWSGWIIRIIIVLVLVGIALWVIFDSKRLTGFFEDFIEWLKDNPVLAPFVLVLAYIVATIFFFPGLILTLGAGFAFNQAYGNVGGKHFG
jgi:hypothetical protein